jgi:uncharacterized RmlC-like cupin family protein
MHRMTECTVIRGGKPFAGRQGLSYFEGVSAESAGAQALCMHLLDMPPGAVALAHLHEAHETAILILSGRARMRYGEGLGEELEVGTGDFLYIPAGMPHQPFNPGDEPCRAVIARTDPNEQESVVLLDDEGRRRP